jgi:hypothetical protein
VELVLLVHLEQQARLAQAVPSEHQERVAL